MKTLLRWLLRLFLGVVLLVVLLVAVVTLLRIPIDLTDYKGPVEALATKALKRQVVIEKSIEITTSLRPVFSMHGLRVHNPDGYSQDTFMYLDTVRIVVELLPLLAKKIHISEIKVQKLEVALEEKEDGAVNWVLASDNVPHQETTEGKKDAGADSKTKSIELAGDSIVVKKLNFEDIAFRYYSPDKPEPSLYKMDKCFGSMVPGKPLNLNANGDLFSFPYTLDISIASLEEFINQNTTWVEVEAEIAETTMVFKGDLDLSEIHRSISLQTTVSGENLSSLNDLVKFDLPPLVSYSVEANLRAKENNFKMENLTLKTGESSLNGEASVTRDGKKIDVEINFNSPVVQINDFIFDDWSWTGDEAAADAPAESNDKKDDSKATPVDTELSKDGHRQLIDPDVLDNLNAIVTIRADQVLSGKDPLGSGYLKVTLSGGKVAIEPLEIKLPGGDIAMSAHVKPGKEQSDASLRVTINNFDIGILARRNKPDVKMSGLVNLDVDLKSSAASMDQMLANGNGYFDFSGQLKNIGAGIIDLWAVNLIAAVVSSTDKDQSQINCAVGRWSVNDGLLTPDVFFIDTSRIRICGKGTVDFKKESIDLTISPTPKRPEFFNLATPLKVKGSFADIGVKVKKGGLVGTAVGFVTSPVHVPIRRMVSKDIPQDGSDACKVTLGPDNRSEITITGCK